MARQLAIVTPVVPGREYLIKLSEAMATRLTEAQFNKVKTANPERFKNYKYIKPVDIDCTWWQDIHYYLTPRKITPRFFECDIYGRVVER